LRIVEWGYGWLKGGEAMRCDQGSEPEGGSQFAVRRVLDADVPSSLGPRDEQRHLEVETGHVNRLQTNKTSHIVYSHEQFKHHNDNLDIHACVSKLL
jgi:hypothetical protein